MSHPARASYAGAEPRQRAAARPHARFDAFKTEAAALQRQGQTMTEIAQALGCDRSIIVQTLYYDRVHP